MMAEIGGMRFFAIILVGLLATACDEVVHERYADFHAAKDAGAIERGWIPAFVPKSAYDIHERHDLDTGAQELSFRLPPADIPAMLSGMERAESDAEAVRRTVMATDWTPDTLDQIAVYQTCRNGEAAALAVNADTGAAFYRAPVKWRSSPCPDKQPT
ncbi:hypothetical protein D3C86_1622200 [compost metagenome]